VKGIGGKKKKKQRPNQLSNWGGEKKVVTLLVRRRERKKKARKIVHQRIKKRCISAQLIFETTSILEQRNRGVPTGRQKKRKQRGFAHTNRMMPTKKRGVRKTDEHKKGM